MTKKIEECELMLKKPLVDWTVEELEIYGDKDYVRREKEYLRREKELKAELKLAEANLKVDSILSGFIAMNFFDRTSTKLSRKADSFKYSLISKYYPNFTRSNKTKCQLTGFVLSTKCIIAAHLFRRENHLAAKELVGLSDIDDVRNGLLLLKPIEHEYDHHGIIFVLEQKQLVMKILNPASRKMKFKDHPRISDPQGGLIKAFRNVPKGLLNSF